MMSSLCFSTMSVLIGAAHRHDPTLSPWVTSAYRSVVNVGILVLLQLHAPRLLLGDLRPALWARGVLGAASLLTYFVALQRLGIGEAAFLNTSSTTWVAALAPVVLGERTRGITWLAVALSLVGMALLSVPRGAASLDTLLAGDALGRAAGLASGLCAAGAYLGVRRASATNRPVTIVFYFTATASIVSVVGAAATRAAWPTDPTLLALLVIAGIAATGGQLAMTEGYRHGPAAPLAVAAAAGPLFTTIAGAVLLDQVPDALGLCGMAILLVASVVLPFLSARAER
jgi:S-adenosylmethionine uptake transporter